MDLAKCIENDEMRLTNKSVTAIRIAMHIKAEDIIRLLLERGA